MRRFKDCKYKGVYYPSVKELWDALPKFNKRGERKLAYSNLAKRIPDDGIVTDNIIYTSREKRNSTPVRFRERRFNSVYALHNHLVASYNVKRTYGCLNRYIRLGLKNDALLEKMLEPSGREDCGYKRESNRIGGCDNLVWQRIHHLGWSEERAKSTPVSRRSEPHPVIYKRKKYPSINACYRAVKPPMSIVKFTEILRENGCISEPTKSLGFRKSIKAK